MKTLLFSLLIFALQNSMALEVVDPVLEFSELEHTNPGCPINSECSKKSGEQITKFESLLKTLTRKNKVKKLNTQLKQEGLPILFLTPKDAKEEIDPVMWNSRCSNHNPKNPNNNIFKAQKFLKSLEENDNIVLTPIRVYYEKTHKDFHIPYQDSLIMIDGDRLITLRDYDDTFYHMAITENGHLEVTNYDSQNVREALDKKITEVKCPVEMDIDKTYFTKTYCSKIWDVKSNKLRTIQYAWTCP